MCYDYYLSLAGPYYATLKEVVNASCTCGPEYYPKRTKLKGYQKNKRR